MDTAPEITELPGGPAIAIRTHLTLAEMSRFFGSAFGELAACGADQIAGPPFAIYHAITPAEIDVEAVMPLRAPVAAQGRVKPLVLEPGPAVQVRHVGPYNELGPAYNAIEDWIVDHHRAKAGPIRELYLSPPNVPPQQHVTLVIQPLAPS